MIYCKILSILLMLLSLDLSSSSFCSLPESFVGIWIQAGLNDLMTINNTWFSLKGTCLNDQQDVKNKYIYYNEQTRCKRCILFIPRHSNTLQYRESECFDADDDNGRICGSITPDTVLYTLFRDNAESIPCPFDQSWYFKKPPQISSLCQPKAFHNCFSSDTFQITYNKQCQSNQNILARCFAQFSDGNMNYIISRNFNQKKFLCFSYTKIKINENNNSLPNEIYLSQDEYCRDLLTRESTLMLSILPSKYHKSKVQMPEWTQGIWLSMEADSKFHIDKSQLIIKMNKNRIIKYDLKFRRILHHENSIRIRAKSLEQCLSVFYCIKLVYRSSAVIDLSIGFDKRGCKDSHMNYTLFKPITKSAISCPQIGIYKSLNSYRSPLSISTCSTGLWTLSIGCEILNKSELILSSSCRHNLIPEVQILTSIKGICLASWHTDHRFQRTVILYDKTKAFCLIQPLKSMTASWILSESSCTHIGLPSINLENNLRYFDTCQRSSSANICFIEQISYLLFFIIMQVLMK